MYKSGGVHNGFEVYALEIYYTLDNLALFFNCIVYLLLFPCGETNSKKEEICVNYCDKILM